MQEMQQMWVQSLGWEDPLEQEMITHSSILAGELHAQRNWRATVHGVTGSDTTEQRKQHTHTQVQIDMNCLRVT